MLLRLTIILFTLVIFSLPLYEVRFVVWGIPFSFPECIAWLSILFCTLYAVETKRVSLKKSMRDIVRKNSVSAVAISLVIIGAIVSSLFSNDLQAGFGVVKAWVLAPILFILAVVIVSQQRPRIWQNLLILYFYSAASVSVVAIAYLLSGELTYDGRLQAFYASPNMLSLYIAPALIYGIFVVRGTQLKSRKHWYEHKALITGLLFIIGTALFFTQSYASWIAVFVAIIIILIASHRRQNSKKWKLIAIIVCAALLAVSQLHTKKADNLLEHFERSSLNSRVMIWRSATKMIADHPFVGIGPNQFQSEYLDYQKYYPPYLEWAVPQPHNLYLAFYLQTGLIGFVGILLLCGYILWRSQSSIKKVPQHSAIIGMLLVILIHGFLDTPYWKGDLAFVFWLIVGALCFSRTSAAQLSTKGDFFKESEESKGFKESKRVTRL